MNTENDTRDMKTSRLTIPGIQIGDEPPRIVISEDDEAMATLLIRAFEKAGYEVIACQNGWDLLKILGVFPKSDAFRKIALVVSDIRLPGISGLGVLRTSRYVDGIPPIILITAFGNKWTREEARRLGAVDVLDKPFDIDDLVDRVRKLVPPSSWM